MGLGMYTKLFSCFTRIEVVQSGKTVQMIATMAINQPRDDESHKTTLIVVPAALLLQVRFLRSDLAQ